MGEQLTVYNRKRRSRRWVAAGMSIVLAGGATSCGKISASDPSTTIGIDQPPQPGMQKTECSPVIMPPEDEPHVDTGPLPESINQKGVRSLQELGAKILDLANICQTPGTKPSDKTIKRTSWQASNGDTEIVTEVTPQGTDQPHRYNFNVSSQSIEHPATRVTGITLVHGSPTQPYAERSRWSLSEPQDGTFILEHFDGNKRQILAHPTTAREGAAALEVSQLTSEVMYAESVIEGAR